MKFTLEELQEKANHTYREYMAAKKELDDFKFNDKKDTYKDKFRCTYCRYSCLTEIVGWDNLCMQGRWADGACKDFELDNELSCYIKKFDRYDFDTWDAIANLLVDNDVKYLLDDEKLKDKAIAIYEIVEEIEGAKNE